MDETTATTSPRPAIYPALLWLMAASALVFFVRLDATGLWAPDEPRFAQVAEEMRTLPSGAVDLVVLRLNGEPYTQKPPLYYWLAAAFGSASGHVGEIAARLPSVLAGLACIWLTFQFALRLTRRPAAAVLSAAMLVTVFRFVHLTRRAGLDVLLTCFILVALLALYELRDAKRDRSRWFYALHVSLGLAVLTKGPVGLLPIPAFAVFLLLQGNLRGFRNVFPWWSFALSIGPALAWIATAVALTPAGFFEAAVVDNLFGRFFAGTAHIRPWTYYFVHFPLEFLPWTLVWPLAGIHYVRTNRERPESDQHTGTRLLVVWIAFCFVFFTISAGKRGLYLLPTYPALSILCGTALEAWLRERKSFSQGVWSVLAGAACTIAGLGAAIVVGDGLSLRAYPGFELPYSMGASLIAIAVGSVAAIYFLRSRCAPLIQQFIVPLVAVYLVEGTVFAIAYPAFDPEKSPAPIARAAAEHTTHGAPIGIFDHPAMAGGVAYYSGHRVVNVRDQDSLDAFFAAGGRNIIVMESKLRQVPRAKMFSILEGSRSGSRRLLIIAPKASNGPAKRT